jgi:hypothetical protein
MNMSYLRLQNYELFYLLMYKNVVILVGNIQMFERDTQKHAQDERPVPRFQ